MLDTRFDDELFHWYLEIILHKIKVFKHSSPAYRL